MSIAREPGMSQVIPQSGITTHLQPSCAVPLPGRPQQDDRASEIP
ncbi:hypothetical protein [Paracoccus sp. (in: a-proteobacteria)]